MTETAKQLPY